ncbi:MAG: hypothetical protein HY789_04420 [Deltaproteobacteria bacterium]|nr:hypothetical protein [Deltaproteobacteria bacterium]
MIRLPDRISSDWTGWLVVLFLANLLIKALPLFRGIMIHPDAPVYLWAAQSLEQGNIPEAIKAYPMLFYPLLVMGVHKLGLDWLAAGRAVSVAASCLALLPFWGLARRFSPGWPCLVICLVFILLPEYNNIAFAAIRDPLYICLALFAVYAAVRFAEARELQWLAIVLVAAVSLPLLRVEGIVLSLVICVWCIISLVRGFTVAGRLWALAAMAGFLTLLFLFFSLSATGRNLLRLDEALFILQKLRTTPPAVTFYLTKLDELARNNVASGYGNNFWQVIERNWPWIYGIGMLRMLENNLSWLFLLLGLFGVKAVTRIAGSGFLLPAVFAANILVILANYLYSGAMEGRIMLFPAVLWLFFAGAALPVVVGYLAAKSGIGPARIKYALIMPFGLLLTLPFAYKTVSMDFNIHIPVLREACLWARDQVLHHDKDWRVMVNMRTMAWFLERRDAEQIAPDNKRMVLTLLDPDKKPEKSTMIVLLLSRRNKEDMVLMENLVELQPVFSRVFTDPEDEKNVVVALWQKKEGETPPL